MLIERSGKNNMRVLLITPSNRLFMPYIETYMKILNAMQISYDVVYWDRFQTGETGEYVFHDSKIGHQRNLYDYYKYCKFIRNILKKREHTKIVIFGLQLFYFLKRELERSYSNNYILDIRDYNKILKLMNSKKIFRGSRIIVLSSEGYKKWLPESNKYEINHNTTVQSTSELLDISTKSDNSYPIHIGYIGAVRNLEVNKKFILELKNDYKYFLKFHGYGPATEKLMNYTSDNEIYNVDITGKYNKSDEKELYLSLDFINGLAASNTINEKTNLTNRLYAAALYGKPIITNEETFMSKIISQYNLGIVVKNDSDLKKQIDNEILNFNFEKFETGRCNFVNKVIKDNDKFSKAFVNFLKS